MTQRIEFFFSMWLWESNLFFSFLSLFIEPYSHFDSKNWTFSIFQNFFNRIYRFAPFSTGLKELNWISKIWLKELNLFWNLTQWIEPSAQKDSKNWTQKDYLTPTTKLFLWLEELNVLFYFKELSLFQKYHSSQWIF